MSLSLADLDQWNPDSIHEVFQATLSRAEVTRLTADSLTRVMAAMPWSGEAHDAALRDNNAIVADLRLHAAEVEAVSRAASIAEVEIRAVKSDWQKICRMADRWGITIDTATNSIVPPNPLAADADEVERRMQIIEDQIVALLQRADDADRDLAAAIDGASGHESADDLNREVQGTTATEEENVDRFIKVFGRPPTTPEDWEKVSWLDPSNSDPTVKGVESSVVVANIRPVPGQGTVRGSLFIMDDQVLDPFAPDGFDFNSYGSLYDYGNNRGFSEHFDLRNRQGRLPYRLRQRRGDLPAESDARHIGPSQDRRSRRASHAGRGRYRSNGLRTAESVGHVGTRQHGRGFWPASEGHDFPGTRRRRTARLGADRQLSLGRDPRG